MDEKGKEIKKQLKECLKRSEFEKIYKKTKQEIQEIVMSPDVTEMLISGNYELHYVRCKICGHRYKVPIWIEDRTDICGFCIAGVPSHVIYTL